ncbi:hypothetical protein ACO22_03913 [Paracoccidioides brasiliensis]|uniref:Uncharacterized protein n=1 Tax=Paracoccidioides brasiliensis TaxID=121759 RepID=A0A1D2JEJ2_PARBR|nr:hypothetical protein ACO22_03913 [Paracoccidioides brasiliensis]
MGKRRRNWRERESSVRLKREWRKEDEEEIIKRVTVKREIGKDSEGKEKKERKSIEKSLETENKKRRKNNRHRQQPPEQGDWVWGVKLKMSGRLRDTKVESECLYLAVKLEQALSPRHAPRPDNSSMGMALSLVRQILQLIPAPRS